VSPKFVSRWMSASVRGLVISITYSLQSDWQDGKTGAGAGAARQTFYAARTLPVL
jgi:hypothetical protein